MKNPVTDRLLARTSARSTPSKAVSAASSASSESIGGVPIRARPMPDRRLVRPRWGRTAGRGPSTRSAPGRSRPGAAGPRRGTRARPGRRSGTCSRSPRPGPPAARPARPASAPAAWHRSHSTSAPGRVRGRGERGHVVQLAGAVVDRRVRGDGHPLALGRQEVRQRRRRHLADLEARARGRPTRRCTGRWGSDRGRSPAAAARDAAARPPMSALKIWIEVESPPTTVCPGAAPISRPIRVADPQRRLPPGVGRSTSGSGWCPTAGARRPRRPAARPRAAPRASCRPGRRARPAAGSGPAGRPAGRPRPARPPARRVRVAPGVREHGNLRRVGVGAGVIA